MTDTTEDLIARAEPLTKWLRNPWSKRDNVDRGPIPEWLQALMLEAADLIEAQVAALRAETARTEAQAAEIAALRGEVERLRGMVNVAGRARLIIDTAFLEMGETVNYAPSVISEVCDMLEPHSTLAPADANTVDGRG